MWCGVVLRARGIDVVGVGGAGGVLMHAVSTLTERGVQKSSQSPVVWQRGLEALCSGIDAFGGEPTNENRELCHVHAVNGYKVAVGGGWSARPSAAGRGR